jgi:methylated-DNA-[protein]-cysteine S-methyltransferase
MPYIHYYHSPIGILKISAEEECITGLSLEVQEEPQNLVSETPPTALLHETCTQLIEYFAGKRISFNLPIKFTTGTPFQHSVWNALRNIPYGETRSYEDIAVAIGNPKAVRAIGQANHNNPVLLLVPCHRVINKNGSLGGFGCGVEIKKQLLQLEGVL